MSVRHIIGNLAKDPVVRQAGRVEIVQLTVLENTATYRGDERVPGLAPLNHWVEAKFELGANAAASLHEGNAVIVVGYERDNSFKGDDGTVYRRVIDAIHIGPDLSRATAVVTPTSRDKGEDAPEQPQPPQFKHEGYTGPAPTNFGGTNAPAADPAPDDDPAASLWTQS